MAGSNDSDSDCSGFGSDAGSGFVANADVFQPRGDREAERSSSPLLMSQACVVAREHGHQPAVEGPRSCVRVADR